MFVLVFFSLCVSTGCRECWMVFQNQIVLPCFILIHAIKQNKSTCWMNATYATSSNHFRAKRWKRTNNRFSRGRSSESTHNFLLVHRSYPLFYVSLSHPPLLSPSCYSLHLSWSVLGFLFSIYRFFLSLCIPLFLITFVSLCGPLLSFLLSSLGFTLPVMYVSSASQCSSWYKAPQPQNPNYCYGILQ